MKKLLLLLSIPLTGMVFAAGIPPPPQFAVGSEPISGFDGTWEMPAKFSDRKLYRGCWDRSISVDLSKAAGISFDFWCEDGAGVDSFVFYVRTGDGKGVNARWSAHRFSVDASRKWARKVIPVAGFKPATGAKGADFSSISGIRVAAYRNSFKDIRCAMANLSVVDALPPEENSEQRAERRRKGLARIPLMSGKTGERRLAWCHSAWGLKKGYDWDASIRFLKDCNFTDIIANLAWGAGAFYGSEVLKTAGECAEKGDALEQCLSACRKYGIKCHVWMVCWKMSRASTKEDWARYSAQGRTQKESNGTLWESWLCPSHPDNIRLTVDAMCELAGKGVDGIHFDYIRYPGSNHCVCDGCRSRFEARFGKVASWPLALRDDASTRAAWNEFRRSNIDVVVRTVSDRVRRSHPDVEISAAVFPNELSAAASVGQQWSRWCAEGWVDTVCPMTYTQSLDRFRSYIRSCREFAGKAKLYPGIGVSASACPNVGTDEITFADEIMILREEGCEGFTLFNFDRRGEVAMKAALDGPLRK